MSTHQLRLAGLAAGALLADLAAYQLAVAAVGPAGELNPVADALAGHGPALVAAKLGQVVAAAAIAWWLAGRTSRRARVAAYLPAVVGLIGAGTAVLAIAWAP